MSRPISRGGRPGTGQRTMLSSSSGARPGTNSRLGTGVVPATPGQTAGYGISLNTEVNVANRPVTQQGMMGMRIATAGPGRQVQDSSYFLGRLHQKTSEIKSELENLRQEIEQDEKNKNQCSQLDRKYEVMLKDVRKLECELADHNLAMDNIRSSTDVDDITEAEKRLSNQNQKVESEVDQLFIVRQEKESNVHRIEDEIRQIHHQQAAKMNELAPEQFQQYQELLQENDNLERILGPKIQEIDLMTQQIAQKQNQLSNDRSRNQYKQLERQFLEIQQEKQMLEDDIKLLQTEPEEARHLMLSKVKDGKAKVVDLDEQINHYTDEYKQVMATLKELQTDIEERQTESSKGNERYELLFQRDKEMSEFLSTVEAEKHQILENQEETKNNIVALLQYSSEEIESPEDLMNDLNHEDEESKSDNSKKTKDRLENEYKNRHAELEKVNSLECKINSELKTLTEKLGTMDNDMLKFDELDSLRDTSENTKHHLVRLKQKYIGRRDSIVQQVQILSKEYQEKLHDLTDMETNKTLDSLEQKLRHYEQNIFHLKQFIETKHRQDNYDIVKKDCLKMVQEINQSIIKHQSEAPVRNLNSVSY